MSIDYEHAQHSKYATVWKKINDICDYETVTDYLIELNPDDDSEENASRNSQFQDRAVFSDIAGQTVRGFVGLVFNKEPNAELPAGLDYLEENADGAGVSIYQQSQEVVEDLARVSLAGLWVDFPKTDGPVSAEDISSRKVFATINHFAASQIWNWRTTRRGSQVLLELVVLKSSEEIVGEDGYSVETQDVFLELYLDNDVYTVREWRPSTDEAEWEPSDPVVPKQHNGQTWDIIPFMFVGAQSNTWRIDAPVLRGLVELNIAHYNNSAIYEDSVFIVGQAQPWMSGLDIDTMKAFEENGYYIGSGRLMGVPSGEKLDFAQPKENTLAREAMKDKLEMMIGLGAYFIQPGSAVKTATQSSGEQRVQHSVLSLISSNVSEAYIQCIEWCGLFMGVTGNIEFKLNQDFVDPDATPQELQQVIAGFMQNAIPMADYLEWMKRHKYIAQDKTVEEFEDEVEPTEPVPLDDEIEEEDDS